MIQIVTQLIEPDIYKSVFEDLKSSGNLNLIENVNLRHGIITYYQRELYEEKWAYDVKNNLSKPYDKWIMDLLTLDEFAGRGNCSSGRILQSLRQNETLENLDRTRKMAFINGENLGDRICRTDEMINFIRAVLSKNS